MILAAVVCFGVSANAQTASCKVVNSKDNASVVASVDYVDEKGVAYVSFSNDAEKPVSVIFSITYRTPNGGGGSKEGSILVPAQSSTSKGVPIGINNKSERLTLTSARCN